LRVLVFDSGLGGLTVFREVARSRAGDSLVYAADDAAFPYGRLDEPSLVSRVLGVIDALAKALRPDLVVIACNTASTLALPALRSRFAGLPFVGTVPAIKPAASASRSRLISVLGTPGTVERDYTQDLIRQHAADCRVALVGAPNLAQLAEDHMRGLDVADERISCEIAPCFVTEGGGRTDVIALACTHYPLLREHLTRLAPWPVEFIDPAPAIARRVSQLLGPPTASGDDRRGGLAPAIFTSGAAPGAALKEALGRFGLEARDLARA